jgi:hypothetical protein
LRWTVGRLRQKSPRGPPCPHYATQ